MKELFELSFSPVNAFFSIMCILLVLYWIMVIITGFDTDLFDIHFDSDSGTHVHTEKHIDADHNEPSTFISILKYFNFDELPLMFILTVIFFVVWFISVNVTWYIGGGNTLLGVILLIPNFIVSLFVVKFMIKPLSFLYKYINHKGEEEIDFLGRRCTVVSSMKDDKIGQIELFVNGDHIKVYARSNTGEELKPGQEAVIINETPDKKYYLIEKFDY